MDYDKLNSLTAVMETEVSNFICRGRSVFSSACIADTAAKIGVELYSEKGKRDDLPEVIDEVWNGITHIVMLSTGAIAVHRIEDDSIRFNMTVFIGDEAKSCIKGHFGSAARYAVIKAYTYIEGDDYVSNITIMCMLENGETVVIGTGNISKSKATVSGKEITRKEIVTDIR